MPAPDAARSDVDVQTTEDGDWCLLAGYLFDKPRASTAAFVADAYRRQGRAAFDTLRGGFVAAVWDRRRDRLFVARDSTGLGPCFYRSGAAGIVVAGSIAALSRVTPPRCPPNRLMTAEYVYGLNGPHQACETFYSGVARLPPAHVLEIDRAGCSVQRYWNPLTAGFAWQTEHVQRRVEEALQQAVDRCLQRGARAIALSGGFDSVAIAALARRSLPLPLYAVSLLMAGTPHDETALQRAVATELDMQRIEHRLAPAADPEGFISHALAHAGHLPCPILSMWQNAFGRLLSQAAEQGVTGIMIGTGGDELFTVDPAYAADLARQLRLYDLRRFIQAWRHSSPLSTGRVLWEILWRAVVRPALANEASRVLPDEWKRKAGDLHKRLRRRPPLAPPPALRRELAHRVQGGAVPPRSDRRDAAYLRAIEGLMQSPLLLAELESTDAWAASCGVRFYYPYYDREVVELALQLRPEALYESGQMKSPLRRLVRQQVIATGGAKQRKMDFTAFGDDLLRRFGPRAWARMGGPLALADLGIVDADAATRWLQRYFETGAGGAWQAWRLIGAECWLRHQPRTS